MAQDIMGKIVRYDKPTLSIVIVLIFLLLTTVHGYASYREYDLLQKGYESYLSYQPEKAAEEFRTFLQEFPQSSARDAALFWLGKSLVQSKSIDEAGRVFIELKREFPDSPFVAFVVTQSEFPKSEKLTTIRETEPGPQLETSKDSADVRQPEPVKKTDEIITAPTMMTDTAATSETPVEKEPEAAQLSIPIQQQMSETLSPVRSETIDVENVEDREPMLSESETTPADGMIAKGEEPEATAPETVAITKAVEQETVSPRSEVSSEQAHDIMKKVEEPEGKESEVKEPVVKEPEVKEPAQLQEDQATREETGKQAVEEKRELPSKTEEQARPDQTVLKKVGIEGSLWSTGDRNQDFIDEQILYNEAVKLNLSADEDELRELREQYPLGIEEVDYLKRFLLICKLIDKKAKEIPGDKIVEVLSVRYKDAGQREQPELAAELQALANKGVTFEEISRSYPDIVHFKAIALQELPDWIQERIQGLQNYEVGVIWSEDGYMILKPIVQIYSYDPFEELSSQKKEKITAYIRSWIAELKGANTR